MEIEQALRDLISKDPTMKTTVVLCCKAQPPVHEDELVSRGFQILEIQSADDECFIYGDITLGNIERLSEVVGIEIVSSAPEAKIL